LGVRTANNWQRVEGGNDSYHNKIKNKKVQITFYIRKMGGGISYKV